LADAGLEFQREALKDILERQFDAPTVLAGKVLPGMAEARSRLRIIGGLGGTRKCLGGRSRERLACGIRRLA